jgi:carbon monoxide dehydrogenase subunit G
MASIRKEMLIDAQPEYVWAAIRDFGAVQRLVPGFLTDCVMEGDTRIVTFFNGRVARERLVDIDDNMRRLVYAEPEGRFVTRSASLEVFADGGGGSRVVWINDLLPNEFAEMIRSNMDRAAIVLKETLERGAASNSGSSPHTGN